MPLAAVPSWHVAQPVVMPVWSKAVTPRKVMVLWWQFSHGRLVGRCLGDFDLTLVNWPPWQLTQLLLRPV